jgi:NAD(P)-dependent dehydrogenase (short-subunit alcohol dehydrogenase family)
VVECKPLWIIVGGRRRLGRALAEDLAADHRLALTSSESWEGESWAAEHRKLNWEARDPGLSARMAGDLERLTLEQGPLEGAVCCAGDFPEMAWGSWSAEELAATWTLNLTFPLLAAQAIAPHLQEGACLQFLLDTAIHRPWLRRLPYSAAKSALAALVPGLAKVLSPRIRVVGHALGTVLAGEGFDTAALAGKSLTGRIGQPADLARALRFAADSPYLTGEIITLDGGVRWAPSTASPVPGPIE